MKRKVKIAKRHANGKIPSREELLAAHRRALEATRRLTPEEGFASLVRAGIYTRAGKLTSRYGG